MAKERGWQQATVWTQTAGPLGELSLEIDYPDLATYERETAAYYADEEVMKPTMEGMQHLRSDPGYNETLATGRGGRRHRLAVSGCRLLDPLAVGTNATRTPPAKPQVVEAADKDHAVPDGIVSTPADRARPDRKPRRGRLRERPEREARPDDRPHGCGRKEVAETAPPPRPNPPDTRRDRKARICRTTLL